MLGDLATDVIALQEADKRLGRRPSALPVDQIERHTGLQPLEMGLSGPSLGWHGNAVLLRPDSSFADVECLDLPGLEPRGAVIVDISLNKGLSVRLVTVHLGLLRNSRMRQMAYIRDAVANRAKRPTVILGDFNEWSRTKGFGLLADEFDIVAPGNSYHAARPVAKLDRFALSRDLFIKDAGVIDNERARRASDHLPIWADIGRVPEA